MQLVGYFVLLLLSSQRCQLIFCTRQVLNNWVNISFDVMCQLFFFLVQRSDSRRTWQCICGVQGLSRYVWDTVSESHHSHPEPLYSGWEILKILCTQQWYQRLVISLNVKFEANQVVCKAFSCPCYAQSLLSYLGLSLFSGAHGLWSICERADRQLLQCHWPTCIIAGEGRRGGKALFQGREGFLFGFALLTMVFWAQEISEWLRKLC